MAFGVTPIDRCQPRPLSGLRFALYAIMSVTLMFLDQRGGWLEQVRYVLQAAAYPIQLAVSSPSTAWRWLQECAETRDSLRAENAELRSPPARARTADHALRRACAGERAAARAAQRRSRPVAEKWLVAEVMNVEPNSLRQSVL